MSVVLYMRLNYCDVLSVAHVTWFTCDMNDCTCVVQGKESTVDKNKLKELQLTR